MFSKSVLSSFLMGVGLLALSLSISSLVPETAYAAGGKVEVCHVPSGDPDNFHTILINSNALPAHLGHADLGEACNALCGAICDDGDACTVDDTGDCEESGCPVSREPVDCDDGSLCTTDSCDSESGCVSTPVVCEASDACHIAACDPVDGACMETPVTCPDGQSCDPIDGSCKLDVSCPCFPLSQLEEEGSMDRCAALDIDGYNLSYNLFANGNYYCSGSEGCVADQDSGDPIVGCQVSIAGSPAFTMALTSDEDGACRALLEANCPSSAAGLQSSSSETALPSAAPVSQ